MAFQSLYRKHRPQTFGELVGQEAVSTALRNAVRESRVGHAYLFSGPRGTGKTTTARLLAKALNCTGDRSGLAPGEPCNGCPSCLEITAGTSMDVVELDAASNRGVGEMRALLERVAYRSAGGARKVYIVDEVHMLTKEASTALLKTLEEPPDHVIFVLATTDPQMVLPTIRSRTQHFEFSLLPADRLAAHLAEIAGREGVEADPEALATIARRAGGSARDALSLLDQALAYGEGQLRPEQIAALFGGTATSARAAIVDALASGDVAGLLERVDDLLGAGVDARTLADDLLRYLREVFLVLSSPGRVRLETPEEERAELAAQGEALGPAAVVRALETLGEAAIEIRRAPDPRLVLEVTLVRLARRDVSSLEALTERVARLERALDAVLRGDTPQPPGRGALASGASTPASSQPHPPQPAAESSPARPAGPKAALGALRKSAPAPEPPASAPPAPTPVTKEEPIPAASDGEGPLSLDDVTAAWAKAVEGFKPKLKAMAKEAHPVRIEGDLITVGLPSRFEKVHLPTITGESATVTAALSDLLGRKVRLNVVLDDDVVVPSASPGPSVAPPVPDPAAGADEMVAEIARPAEPSGGGRGVDSPVSLVIETFGASIESETVRE
ncbi:MAG TPA: DNA polymerase III subunit gamma/tau [Acidimicrobiia bacterium]|jgi:DNA polymerase-3 subunit gamma/tau|nr:DNA polymerase III subunit gamma/tau [Acidimicrobiia bacterium]